jgi:transposase-like protein
MTNHRNVKPDNMSPCPLCSEPMKTPMRNPDTGKFSRTRCAKCGTTRTLVPAEDHTSWN